MFRATLLARRTNWNSSQVMGATVPSYDRFPFRARDILRLYRRYWRLVHLLPPSERMDAGFKLRNEFRSKRHITGEKRIGLIYRKALQQFESYKLRIEERGSRANGTVRRKNTPGSKSHQVDAVSVDGAWMALKMHANGTLPNLRNVQDSRKLPQPDVWRAQEYRGGAFQKTM